VEDGVFVLLNENSVKIRIGCIRNIEKQKKGRGEYTQRTEG